jgi:hypothetical protein
MRLFLEPLKTLVWLRVNFNTQQKPWKFHWSFCTLTSKGTYLIDILFEYNSCRYCLSVCRVAALLSTLHVGRIEEWLFDHLPKARWSFHLSPNNKRSIRYFNWKNNRSTRFIR